MSATLNQQSLTSAANSGVWKTALALGLFALLWADLIRQLGYHWDADEQYAYGWFVPFLALGLFWKRWLVRPEPPVASGSGFNFLLSAFVVLLALALLPVRVVYEINPDWPLPQWMMAFMVVALSLYAVFLMGGTAWVRHFLFPICFILVALQWPYRIEQNLTQGLMRVVANLTVELLGWLDIPAVQHGNLVEVGTGTVGIAEACSGIRSFQSTLMASLFLGELYFLRWPRRFLLVFCGAIVAFSFNVCRTLFLTWKASADGIDAVEKWHDAAGMSIFLASFACLWLLAISLKKGNRAGLEKDGGPLTANRGMGTADDRPRTTDHRLAALRIYLLTVGCWSVAVLGLNELWYRSHEIKDLGAFHWSVGFPTTNPDYKEIEMASRTKNLIGSDMSACGSWSLDDGSQWTVYFFRWNPTSIQNVLRARIHRPERCLPAAGLRELADDGMAKFAVGGLQLPFRQSIYESDGKTLYVFYCQWEDGSETQGGVWGSKMADRIRSVWVGRRLLGQQTMEVILTGPPTIADAAALLRKQLPGLIKIETPGKIAHAAR